jgi:hypothetical protein
MKAITVLAVAALGTSLSGCAPGWVALPLAGGAILATISHPGPHTSTAPLQPPQHSEALSSAMVDSASGPRQQIR